MFNTYIFMKKNRLHKKWQVYKKIWDLSFDLTLFFYAGMLLAYIVYIVIVEQNILLTLQQHMPSFQKIHMEVINSLVLLFPFMYWFRSFQQPGILFTSAEWKLTTLPYLTKTVWKMLARERNVLAFVKFSGIGILYFIFSTSALSHILLYVVVLWIIHSMMIIIQWKLFQQPLWLKLLTGLTWAGIVFISYMLPGFLQIIFPFLLLMAAQVIGYRRIFHKIDWDRVCMAADYKVWNLPFVSRVTKVSIKKEKKKASWQHRLFWKKPFSFNKNTLYHRLWFIYITKNSAYIAQIIGVLLLLNISLAWLKEWLFYAAILITIHVWSYFLSILFKDRFSVDIVEVLPWSLSRFKKSYMKWGYGLSGIFMFPFILWLIRTFSGWNLLLFLSVMSAFLFYFQMKLVTEEKRLVGKTAYFKNERIIVYGLMAGIMLSAFFQEALVINVVLVIYGWLRHDCFVKILNRQDENGKNEVLK